jgi:hypothetical protein
MSSVPDDEPEGLVRAAWREWCRATERRETLLKWAVATLALPNVLACCCEDGACLRCRTSLAALDDAGDVS